MFVGSSPGGAIFFHLIRFYLNNWLTKHQTKIYNALHSRYKICPFHSVRIAIPFVQSIYTINKHLYSLKTQYGIAIFFSLKKEI